MASVVCRQDLVKHRLNASIYLLMDVAHDCHVSLLDFTYGILLVRVESATESRATLGR